MKSGFVVLIGRPNVGKSTLINSLIGKKVVIVSNKPQTTRNSIRCIYNDSESQIIFLDTPGVHKAERKIGKIMVNSIETSIKNSDLKIFIVDAKMAEKNKIILGDLHIIEFLNEIKACKDIILAFNKIDAVLDKNKFLKAKEEYIKLLKPKETVEISAVKNLNKDKFLSIIKKYLPEGPRFYPENMTVDRPIEFQISEIIREKIFMYLKDEVPHRSAVKVDRIEDKIKLVEIFAHIYVERESHKKIVVGSKGKMLKKIGSEARKELEFILQRKIYLNIKVKVKKNWTNDEFILLNDFGYKIEIGV